MSRDTLRQAWALKDDCYAAWHTEPPRARDAARALAALQAVDPDPTLRALAEWTAGIATLAEGALQPALAHLEQAQACFSQLQDEQHAAEAQVPQMVALLMLGRDADAVARGQSALARFNAVGDQRSAGKVDLNLGSMLARQDRHAEAEPHFRRAVVRFAQLGDRELSILADGSLANALSWQFEFDEALLIYERVRQRAAAHGYKVLVAQAHQGIGGLELHRGRWHRALSELATACRLLDEAGAPPQRRIEAELTLADAYLAVNLLDEAVALYERLIDRAEAHAAEANWALLQHSRALGRLGETSRAVAGFELASQRYAAAGNEACQGYADVCRCRVELAAGRPAEACASAERAEARLRDAGITGWRLEARSLRAAALAALQRPAEARGLFESVLAEAAALPQVVLACHAGLAALAGARGDRAAARRSLQRALRIADEAQAALPSDELRSAFSVGVAQVHQQLVALAWEEGRNDTLLRDIEAGHARALTMGWQQAEVLAPDSTRLQWLREAWRQALSDGDSARLPVLQQRIAALEQALAEQQRRDALELPAPGAAAAPALDVAGLQAALGAERALVMFHSLGGRWLACVVTGDAVLALQLPAPDVGAALRGLRFQIDAVRFGPAALQRHHAQLLVRTRSHLQALHRQLWAPLLPALGGRRQVIVAPHGALHELPWAALHDGAQWLVQHCEITLVPSASAWLSRAAAVGAAPVRLLAVGVGAAELPHIGRELDAVAEAFGAGATVLREAAATQPALRQAAAGADVLHLACHGRFRADNPGFSFLQLADGPLTLHELRRWRLPARLVVLSACETAAARVQGGDEAIGMVRGCLLAGARTVLATLWPVQDQASAILMTDFYRALQAGATPAAALRQAQAALAGSGAHPWQWAGFTLHGLR